MTLREIENAIVDLTHDEKLYLIRRLREDVGIEQREGVMGGDACIAGTRIPVWLLVSLKSQGATESDLLLDYPSLNADVLAATWAYADAHPDEIRAAIHAHHEATSFA